MFVNNCRLVAVATKTEQSESLQQDLSASALPTVLPSSVNEICQDIEMPDTDLKFYSGILVTTASYLYITCISIAVFTFILTASTIPSLFFAVQYIPRSLCSVYLLVVYSIAIEQHGSQLSCWFRKLLLLLLCSAFTVAFFLLRFKSNMALFIPAGAYVFFVVVWRAVKHYRVVTA